jgi:hypothetical protein
MAADEAPDHDARQKRGVRRTVLTLVVIALGLYGWFILKGVTGALQQ